ncbi:hypothetical protein K435DRAFT_48796 [Dendrothele bispora CBS 962.96]|uniref:Uncharacterized protein n=1 Tax=Dendrothele bispora (strain CBS 962.96) TaxID=1314807 RepID=A0A4S8M7X7_DENBC|nr:hypothetical protein K435DRAFT_48796 [Dendrothele bispora CBS 962.96]
MRTASSSETAISEIPSPHTSTLTTPGRMLNAFQSPSFRVDSPDQREMAKTRSYPNIHE